jgi:5-methylcytosine-specific restriction endonuclease McrA
MCDIMIAMTIDEKTLKESMNGYLAWMKAKQDKKKSKTYSVEAKRNITCKECKTVFVKSSYRGVYTGRSADFCSEKCSYEDRYSKWLEGTYETSDYRFTKAAVIRRHANKCKGCGINTHNGKPLTLEMDHIDGDYRNNSCDNLRLLCPNCHSQTDTYRSKNAGKGRKSHRNKLMSGVFKAFTPSFAFKNPT